MWFGFLTLNISSLGEFFRHFLQGNHTADGTTDQSEYHCEYALHTLPDQTCLVNTNKVKEFVTWTVWWLLRESAPVPRWLYLRGAVHRTMQAKWTPKQHRQRSQPDSRIMRSREQRVPRTWSAQQLPLGQPSPAVHNRSYSEWWRQRTTKLLNYTIKTFM